jgi:hypothetical protein
MFEVLFFSIHIMFEVLSALPTAMLFSRPTGAGVGEE